MAGCFRGISWRLLLPITLAPWAAGQTRRVVINEIMYNPGDDARQLERVDEEFLELRNLTNQAISLRGWYFDSGLRFLFPDVTLPANGFVVVAKSPDTLKAKHSGLGALGPYEGGLSNSGERVRLKDANGRVVDEARYADQGHFALRKLGQDRGYPDWTWDSPSDGDGFSLERVSAAMPGDVGMNWRASQAAGGSPGTANSVAVEDAPPLIFQTRHEPAIPKSSEPVTITAQFLDETGVAAAKALWRLDGDSAFQEAPMTLAEGRGTARIPPQVHGAIVEFFVEAADTLGQTRRWPNLQGEAPAAEEAFCLYQVDDAFDLAKALAPGAKPMYRFVAPKREIEMLRKLNGMSGAEDVYNSRINATFIAIANGELETRHQVSARIRGHGSRSEFPPNLRVTFPHDHLWKGWDVINLNTQHTHAQAIGYAIHRLAGMPSYRATPVKVRVNGEDWASAGSPQFGHYVHNQVLDDSFVESQFAGEEGGSLYRGIGNANLNDLGPRAENYRRLYDLRNNVSSGDYADLVRFIKVLNQKRAPKDYFEQVAKVADLDQWARYFAVDALLCNLEGGLPTGRGDDFAMFRGEDGRFRLVPYDLDSILGLGERDLNIQKSIMDYANVQGLRLLFQEPEFKARYHAAIRDVLDTVYRPEVLNRLVDEVLGDWIPEDERGKIKGFISKRAEAVRRQIGSSSSLACALPKEKGYFVANETPFVIYGRHGGVGPDFAIAGLKPRVNPATGAWRLLIDPAKDFGAPGVRRFAVPGEANEGIAVWYRGKTSTPVAGALTEANVTWNAKDGPFVLRGSVSVPEGLTLRIEAGTTIFAEPGASLEVAGSLEAKGTAERPIVFTLTPEASGRWNGLRLGGKATLTHCEIDRAADQGGCLRGGQPSGAWEVSHVVFRGCEAPLLVTEGRLTLRQSALAGQASERPLVEADGPGVIEANRFAISGDGLALRLGGGAEVRDNRFHAGAGTAVAFTGRAWLAGNAFEVASDSAKPIVQADDVLISAGNRFPPTRAWVSRAKLILSEGDGPLSGAAYQLRAELVERPPEISASSKAVFRIGGAGVFGFRYRLDGKDWSDELVITERDFRAPPTRARELVLTGLAPGEHRLDVIGRDYAGQWQAEAEASAATWRIDPNHVPIRLNEILAVNAGALVSGGDHPDAIELRNEGDVSMDVGGFALSDDKAETKKYTLPGGTLIEAGGYLVVLAGQGSRRSGALRAPFSLAAEGEAVFLYDKSGKLLDSASFGSQAADYSIGRVQGTWRLCRPTLGQANEPVECALAAPRITELLANGGDSGEEEFVELANESDRPMELAGLLLTDNLGHPRNHRPLPPLSFLGPRSAIALKAAGPGLGFKLDPNGDVLGLWRAGKLLDFVAYPPQTPGLSQARGADGKWSFARPTPGRRGERAESSAGLLRVTEIHYHPDGNEETEFLEIANAGQMAISLAGVRLRGGARFSFDEGTLEPGQALVLAKNRAAFARRYEDVRVAGEFQGKLSNNRGALILEGPDGQELGRASYSDSWYPETDGQGKSLERSGGEGDKADDWRPSEQPGGSPGR